MSAMGVLSDVMFEELGLDPRGGRQLPHGGARPARALPCPRAERGARQRHPRRGGLRLSRLVLGGGALAVHVRGRVARVQRADARRGVALPRPRVAAEQLQARREGSIRSGRRPIPRTPSPAPHWKRAASAFATRAPQQARDRHPRPTRLHTTEQAPRPASNSLRVSWGGMGGRGRPGYGGVRPSGGTGRVWADLGQVGMPEGR